MSDSDSTSHPGGGKGRDAFRTISEVADQLDLPQHVLRFWESKFSQIKPLKRGGNRRYYRPDDVVLITAIKKLLHTDGYTIRGVQKLFKAQGVKATVALAIDDDATESNTLVSEEEIERKDADTFVAPSPSRQLSKEAIATIVARLKSIRAQLD